MTKRKEIKERINNVIDEQIMNLQNLKETNYIDNIIFVSDLISNSIKKGGKLLIAGNGGSAADAQHFAAEIIGRFVMERQGYPAIALTTDTSILTAIGNDYGYEEIFSRQIEGLGKKGDIFIGISTSGNSINVLKAIDAAHKKGVICVGLTGKNGGKMKDMCDYLINF